jgi:homoserine kinase
MVNLYDELLRRFPEVSDSVQEYADLPYILMSCLAEWLGKRSPDEVTPELLGRVTAFYDWCEEQPRGDTADDDLYTILVVGFFEHLFRTDTTRVFLPSVVSRESLVENADYLKTWVGEDDYQKALSLYAPPA